MFRLGKNKFYKGKSLGSLFSANKIQFQDFFQAGEELMNT